MKNILFIFLIVASVLFGQLLNAQSRKEKRQAKKLKAKVEQANPNSNKQNGNSDKPTSVISQDTLNKPDVNQQNNNDSKNPTSSVSGRNPQAQGDIDINAIAGNSKPLVSERPNGNINWTDQFIEAKGYAALDTSKSKNMGAAKAMAIRGAVVVAQRNLLEIIKGVNVTSETTVKDMITEGDYIYTRVDGIIKGAQMVGEPIEKDGMIEVKMRVPIYQRNGLASALYNDIPASKSPDVSPATQEKMSKEVQDQVLNGLAFKLNGKTFDPSMFPVVVDESGKMVFDFSKIYDPNKGDFPKIFGATEVLFKEFGFNKGVEYLDILRTEPGRIVLDNNNIKKINWGKIAKTAGSIGKFLMMFI